jgi:phosphohistidine phosphatase
MDKILILVRHAQSINIQSGIKDVERTLTDKGVQDASKAGKYLKDKNIFPDFIFTSHAIRALSTARLITDQLGLDESRLTVLEDLYEASLRILLRIINELDHKIHTVLIIGHNPSISFLSEFLTDGSVGEISPSGFCIINFSDTGWENVNKGTGKSIDCKSPSDIVL